MLKLTEAADLEKAGHSLGSFFAKQAADLEKNFAFHKAVAVHHHAMAAAHTTHAAETKATHAGLPDDHELKSHLGKVAAHHEAMAIHHTAVAKAHEDHAETMKGDVDAMKVLASDWGGPTVKAANGTPLSVPTGDGAPATGIAAMFNQTSEALLKKTLESFDTDPQVADFVRSFALKQISTALGDKIVPDNVRGVITNFPVVTAVPRAGQREIPKNDVPLEFEKMLSLDDGSEQ
jgi:hypothetical protein